MDANVMDLTMTLDEDFEILALNGVTGECLTTDDVLPILILPCATPEFEAGIWAAVIDAQRDWTDVEREYLRRNEGIRETLADWARFMGGGNWTDANLEFINSYLKENE